MFVFSSFPIIKLEGAAVLSADWLIVQVYGRQHVDTCMAFPRTYMYGGGGGGGDYVFSRHTRTCTSICWDEAVVHVVTW